MSNITLGDWVKRYQGVFSCTAHLRISEELINNLLIQLNTKARVGILQETGNRRANTDIAFVTDRCRYTISVAMAVGDDNQTDWNQNGGADE